MKRKIIKQGKDTLTVTLPKPWVKKYELKAGDELEMTDQQRSLIISTEKGPTLSSVTVDISGLSPQVIWRYILSAYRAGFSEIKVIGIGKGKDNIRSAFSRNANIGGLIKGGSTITPSEMILLTVSSSLRSSFNWQQMIRPIEVVSACVDRLIGMEIIDQKEDSCVIKDLSETTHKEFDNALRRIFLLLKLEAEYVVDALKGEKGDLKSIHIIDTNLDRFEDFCLRVLNKNGAIEHRKTPTMHSLIFLMEMIGDELRKIGSHILENKKPASKLIGELFKVQAEQLNAFYELFYKYDKEKVLKIYERDREGSALIEKNYRKLNYEEQELLHHFKKIGIYILGITELRIDLEV